MNEMKHNIAVNDRDALQNDLSKLEQWSKKWLLEFSKSKCKVMHIGNRNPKHTYSIDGTVLDTTSAEKDLGVYVTSDFKVSTQVSKVAAKANSIVGRIRKSFTYMDKQMFMSLYTSLVRPVMEYAVQAWSPYLQQDINKLEKIQQRATKLVPELRNLPYEERRIQLGLPTLLERRERGDLIEVFKFLNGYENIDRHSFFKLASEVGPNITRGSTFKLKKPRWNSTKRNNFFDTRVINKWNSLPESVVNSKSVNSFKNKLDKYTHIHTYERRGSLRV
ncbi:uncharacterized protein [Antedon mediterranea]|uniref:uncharacterized protein n=1 Tax=Antedon mediterranea TaxID=105859 RepID=UPI003AF514F4